MLQKENLEQHLMASLSRNLDNVDTFKSFTCSPRDLCASLLREEIIILQCLFRIYKQYDVPKVNIILDYLRYQLTETRFQGLRIANPMLYQSDEVLFKLSKKLNCLAIQQVFNFFQVSQFAAPHPEKNDKLKSFLQGLFKEPHFKDLANLILNIPQHDEQTALVYLTFRQVIEAVKTLDLYKVPDLLKGLDTDKAVGQVREINFMNYLSDLRQVDELFFDESYAGSGSQKEEL